MRLRRGKRPNNKEATMLAAIQAGHLEYMAKATHTKYMPP